MDLSARHAIRESLSLYLSSNPEALVISLHQCVRLSTEFKTIEQSKTRKQNKNYAAEGRSSESDSGSGNNLLLRFLKKVTFIGISKMTM
jgi:hypothetical protein